jgi:nitrite reductase/ring-hydroxylating ferredoxin subunit
MGLRDLVKQTAKSLLGKGGDAAPRPAPAAAPVRSSGAARAAPAQRVLPPAAGGWRAVAWSEQVTAEKAGTFPIDGGVIVAVFRHEGRLYAIDNACAHEDGPVGEGAVSGKCVQCPYHDWEYDFTTGACHTDPERSLATYAVREQDGAIWVGPRLTEGTGARGGDHNDGLETITR